MNHLAQALAQLGSHLERIGEGGGLLLVGAAVLATCWKVWRGVDKIVDNHLAVTQFRADWESRGLNAAGAIAEQADYRARVVTNTAAIAALDERLKVATDSVTGALGDLHDDVKDLRDALAAAGYIDRRD